MEIRMDIKSHYMADEEIWAFTFKSIRASRDKFSNQLSFATQIRKGITRISFCV